MFDPWNLADEPRRPDAVFAITGATSGIGYFIAEQLAQTGAEIVLLGRSEDRIDRARREIESRVPGAHTSRIRVDLSDLESATAAGQALAELPRLDALVANAGLISAGRRRRVTAQGHELVVGTNHLGHFALVASAHPVLEKTAGSRVISMGSMLVGRLKLDPGNLMSERSYRPLQAYANSKHATELFGFDYHRRLRRAGLDITSVVAHPGGAMDQMTPSREGIAGANRATRTLFSPVHAVIQGKDSGALPATRAVLDAGVRGGDYVGPIHTSRGRPVRLRPHPMSVDPERAAWLWQRTEELTGIRLLSD
ncbi:SDR family NAD(P)-dependent oxidoreductase [Mycetocola saprophilus]|uniref:SDR family NAD(P)-dependent oxidoreductase n=1 Tax=Mycetocola saprophilus TaxID=76636 RepID=UPI003BF36266